MIKKVVTSSLVASVLMINGCSSYPDSAKDVAQAVCSAFKSGDLESAKTYMSEVALAKLEDKESLVSKFFSLPEFKAKAAKLSCESPTQIREFSQGHVKYTFDEFSVELKQVKDKWQLIN